MKRFALSVLLLVSISASPCFGQKRQITYREYLDKVHGGWLGKIAGLALGVPKEFAEPWPPSDGDYFAEVPTHFSDQYSGDDLYFPLLAQICLQKYGTHPTYEQYMTEWKNQLFTARVWGANSIAMEHYFAGVMPPKTGYPGWNGGHDIDAQIGFDTIGWVAPGLVNTAARMADHPAHIMTWGDGADGAVFIAAALSESPFSSDIEHIIRTGQSVLPAKSAYREMIDDVIRWHKEQPDWRVTRQWLARKYNRNLDPNDISAVVNGGAVLIGLLYGDKNFGKTVSIAMRCRWDSDCNAATAGGVLGTVLGASGIDPRWSMIFHDTYENYCLRGLPRWIRISDIARDTAAIGETVIRENGGEISGTGPDRILVTPVQKPEMLTRQEVYSEELIARNETEMREYYRRKLASVTETWDRSWQMTMASFENPPQMLPDYMGRKHVLKAQPSQKWGVILECTVTLPAGKHTYLKVGVAHHPTIANEQTGFPEIGAWKLDVLVDGQRVGGYSVSTQGGLVVWEDPQFDLTPYAGRSVKLTLVGNHDMKYTEFYMASQTTYWSGIELITLDQPESWR
jgi:hypothetical protein